MPKTVLLRPLILLLALAGCAVTPEAPSSASSPAPATAAATTRAIPTTCPPPAKWVLAGTHTPLSTAQLLDSIDSARVILLGERHDRMDEHRWQLHLLAAINGRHAGMVVGFEMFARPQQPMLDDWVAGQLSQTDFLDAVQWDTNWGFPANLYLPLLHFVRLNRLPAVALNIERKLLWRISTDGWDAVPLSERYQIKAAAQGPPGYDALLDEVMAMHDHGTPLTNERRQAFHRAQGAWDRAMAQAIASALETHTGPVVGLVGRGHMQWGYGIPYQLQDMGIDDVATLLPFDAGDSCLDAESAPADGLYGLPATPDKGDTGTQGHQESAQ